MAHNQNNKQFSIPVCIQQRQFEDLVKTLIKLLASFPEEEQSAVLDYALGLEYKRLHKHQ